MITAEYAARRKGLALHIGLGRKPKPASIAMLVEPIPVPSSSHKAAPKRKAEEKASEVAFVEKPAPKPKAASRKTLKVASDAVDVGKEG